VNWYSTAIGIHKMERRWNQQELEKWLIIWIWLSSSTAKYFDGKQVQLRSWEEFTHFFHSKISSGRVRRVSEWTHYSENFSKMSVSEFYRMVSSFVVRFRTRTHERTKRIFEIYKENQFENQFDEDFTRLSLESSIRLIDWLIFL